MARFTRPRVMVVSFRENGMRHLPSPPDVPCTRQRHRTECAKHAAQERLRSGDIGPYNRVSRPSPRLPVAASLGAEALITDSELLVVGPSLGEGQ